MSAPRNAKTAALEALIEAHAMVAGTGIAVQSAAMMVIGSVGGPVAWCWVAW